MKKIIAGFFVAALLIPSSVAFAQTTSATSTISPQYIALLEQLLTLLESELAALQAQGVAIPATATTASIDPGSLSAQSNSSAIITGTAPNSSSVYVYLLQTTYTGGLDYSSVSSADGTVSGQVAYISDPSPSPVTDGRWTAYFGGQNNPGQYRIEVYDGASHSLITSGTLTVSNAGSLTAAAQATAMAQAAAQANATTPSTNVTPTATSTAVGLLQLDAQPVTNASVQMNNASGSSQSATFTITFNVQNNAQESIYFSPSSAAEVAIMKNGVVANVPTNTAFSSSALTSASGNYVVSPSQSRSITVTASVSHVSGSYNLVLSGLKYGITDSAPAAKKITAPSTYKTSSVTLQNS